MEQVLNAGLFEPVVIETPAGVIRLWIRKLTISAGGAFNADAEIVFEAPEEVSVAAEKGIRRATGDRR